MDSYQTFKILPILGRKIDVPQGDLSLFKQVAEGIAATHDVGGVNFDLTRKRNTCSKAKGAVPWSNASIGGTQDLSTYTEVEASGDPFTLTAGKVEIAALGSDETSYVYKDYSAAYFASDFEIQFEMTFTGGTNGYMIYPLLMANAVGSYDTLEGTTEVLGLSVYNYASGMLPIGKWAALIQLDSAGNSLGDIPVPAWATIKTSGPWYCTLERDESVGTYGTLYFRAYSDSLRTQLEHEVVKTLGAKDDYRYLYIPCGRDDAGNSATASIDIENVQIVNPLFRNCQGLFELDSGSNRDHIIFSSGKCYIYDSSFEPQLKEDAGTTLFATDDIDLYSIVRAGAWMIFTDRGEHEPFKWKNGESNLTEFIQTGTAYKFRYLESFMRRIIGVHSDQTDGDIDVRWSESWPATGIDDAAMGFPAGNQLYVPNDDSITGIATMGNNRCFVYCEDSIQQLVYYPDYTTPFGMITTVTGQGGAGHHSIIKMSDRHYVFNRYYGFCEYRGGTEFPYGGRPISEDIEFDLKDINAEYYDSIVGVFIPFTNEMCWAVPVGDTVPTKLFFYNLLTGQWRIEDRGVRYVDVWRLYTAFTWNDLITALGGTGATWDQANKDDRWSLYTSNRPMLVTANEDGQLLYRSSNQELGADFEAYRIEPIMDFGDPLRRDIIQEIWFDIGHVGDYEIDIYHRGGDTVGEVIDKTWTQLNSINCNSPANAVIRENLNYRLHQFKWGTDEKDEPFEVSGITFKYVPEGVYS